MIILRDFYPKYPRGFSFEIQPFFRVSANLRNFGTKRGVLAPESIPKPKLFQFVGYFCTFFSSKILKPSANITQKLSKMVQRTSMFRSNSGLVL